MVNSHALTGGSLAVVRIEIPYRGSCGIRATILTFNLGGQISENGISMSSAIADSCKVFQPQTNSQ